MYLSLVANREQFLRLVDAFAHLNPDCVDFTRYEINPERGAIRNFYEVEHTLIQFYMDSLTWSFLVVNPRTSPVGTCKIVFHGDTTNYASVVLSDTVQPEHCYDDIFHFLLRKLQQYGADVADEVALQTDLFWDEVDTRERYGMKTYSITPSMYTYENVDVKFIEAKNNVAVVTAQLSNSPLNVYVIIQHPRSRAIAWLKNLIDIGNTRRAFHALVDTNEDGSTTMGGVASVVPLHVEKPTAIFTLEDDAQIRVGTAHEISGIKPNNNVCIHTLNGPIEYPYEQFILVTP